MIKRTYRWLRDIYILRFLGGVRISRKATVVDSLLRSFVHVGDYCFLLESNLAEYTTVGRNTVIRNADIGKFCSISWNVTVGATPHDYKLPSTHAFHYIRSFGFVKNDNRRKVKATLGNDVWVGANAIIFPGVSIGHGAVIGAGAVVTRDVAPYEIVAGCPAKQLGYRFDSNSIEALLQIKWWDWDAKKIAKHIHLFSQPLNILELKQLKG